MSTLEERLQRLEDEHRIAQLVASYGPLVDHGDADQVADLWAEEGSYDVDELYMGDRAAIHDMVLSEGHQGLIGGGVTHFLGPAHVRVDGDTAVAVCHSILLVHRDGRYYPVRSGANRWEFERRDGDWKAVRRVTRTLDGRPEAHGLFEL